MPDPTQHDPTLDELLSAHDADDPGPTDDDYYGRVDDFEREWLSGSAEHERSCACDACRAEGVRAPVVAEFRRDADGDST